MTSIEKTQEQALRALASRVNRLQYQPSEESHLRLVARVGALLNQQRESPSRRQIRPVQWLANLGWLRSAAVMAALAGAVILGVKTCNLKSASEGNSDLKNVPGSPAGPVHVAGAPRSAELGPNSVISPEGSAISLEPGKKREDEGRTKPSDRGGGRGVARISIVPEGFQAKLDHAERPRSILLSWDGAASDPDRLLVEISRDEKAPKTFVSIANLAGAERSYTYSLEPSPPLNLHFRLRAILGAQEGLTEILTVDLSSIKRAPEIEAPMDVRVTRSGEKHLQVTWGHPGGASRIEVQSSEGFGEYARIVETNGQAREALLPRKKPRGTNPVLYRVVAFDKKNTSAASEPFAYSESEESPDKLELCEDAFSTEAKADSVHTLLRNSEEKGTTVFDQSGGGHHVSLPQAGVTRSQPGLTPGRSTCDRFLSLDGSAPSLPLSPGKSAGGTQLSVQIWVRVRDGYNGDLLSFVDGSRGPGALRVTPAGLSLLHPSGKELVARATRWDSSKFHQIVFTQASLPNPMNDKPGTLHTLYLDGRLIGRQWLEIAPGELKDLTIGSLGARSGLQGDLDEVAIFATALREERVAAHYLSREPALGGAPLLQTSTAVGEGSTDISVSWTAPPGATPNDWVGIFPASAPGSDAGYKTWTWTYGASSGKFTTPIPLEPGLYEFRYVSYAKDLARSTVFVSTQASPSKFPITPSVPQPPAGSAFSVSFTAPPGRLPQDWIAVFPVGAPNSGYLSWKYTDGAAAGSLDLVAPDVAGDYELRYVSGVRDFTRIPIKFK